MLARRIAVVLIALATLVGCSSSGSSAAPDAADRTFLQDMISHHERAIAVARIGIAQASDPRVLAFARRIVREQTPELTTMQGAAKGLSLDLTTGARMAMNRITDAQVTALRAMHGTAFDRQFVTLNITSERGAYAMARTELANGSAPTPKKVAKAIANSPSEIAELSALLTALP